MVPPLATKTRTLDDLLACLGKRSPEEDGEGVIGRWESDMRPSTGEVVGESKEASETLVPAAGEASSDVLGTYKQLFKPKAILAFLHLLPILVI